MLRLPSFSPCSRLFSATHFSVAPTRSTFVKKLYRQSATICDASEMPLNIYASKAQSLVVAIDNYERPLLGVGIDQFWQRALARKSSGHGAKRVSRYPATFPRGTLRVSDLQFLLPSPVVTVSRHLHPSFLFPLLRPSFPTWRKLRNRAPLFYTLVLSSHSSSIYYIHLGIRCHD